MSNPIVMSVTPDSPAAKAGVCAGDEVLAINGVAPRDIIEWNTLGSEPDPELEISRGGLGLTLTVEKDSGATLGIEVESALFDQVRTCDNHCEFCFIYQLPPGMRKSLYVKDDDYRLSFLYGNFTTLTRFTEADLERVITEKLSPLYVSIHATDTEVRSRMLRNRRGGMSLRWLRALLDNGIDVHGQIVVCPGVNDDAILHDTFAGIFENFSDIASVAAVPLGISRWSSEPSLRSHTQDEAQRVVDAVSIWQERFTAAYGRSVVYAADEYYVLAGSEFPPAGSYDQFQQLENGIGMARAFEQEFAFGADFSGAGHGGFFALVDGAPAEGYRAERSPSYVDVDGESVIRDNPVNFMSLPASPAEGFGSSGGMALQTRVARPAGSVTLLPSRSAKTAIITSAYGASVLRPLLAAYGYSNVRIIEIANTYFGGNIGVTGLLTGEDVRNALSNEPLGDRYLLPDVCLSNDRFLDGISVGELPRAVEVVPTNGRALRAALDLAQKAA